MVNDYESEMAEQLDKKKQLEKEFNTLSASFEKLKSTNFVNEVFHISIQKNFGTISGFKLDVTEKEMESWMEINAGLGQTAYLLAVIAHRFSFGLQIQLLDVTKNELKSHTVEINLCGAHSTINLKNEKNPTKYPLYYMAFNA